MTACLPSDCKSAGTPNGLSACYSYFIFLFTKEVDGGSLRSNHLRRCPILRFRHRLATG